MCPEGKLPCPGWAFCSFHVLIRGVMDRKGQEPDVLIFLSSLERMRVLLSSCSCEIRSLHESFPAVTSSLHNVSTSSKLVDKSQELGFLDAVRLLIIIPKLGFR